MRQSSVFCIWCFMFDPKIESLNQTPLCRWGNHRALYNFTVGITLYFYSNINLPQFSRQGFTYFTNSNWGVSHLCIDSVTKTESISRRQVLSPFPWDSRNCISVSGPSHDSNLALYLLKSTLVVSCCSFCITNWACPNQASKNAKGSEKGQEERGRRVWVGSEE